MCRLFGLHAGSPVRATFWLLDAPDSLSKQSYREPDGAGIGVFGERGEPIVDKQPIAAWEDRQFAVEARALTSATFVAHVRYASTGENSVVNTHPFIQDSRIFAHNGAVADIEALDRRLATLGVADLVSGQTDSERVFALITAEVRSHDADVEAGLASALSWIADHLPIYSLNLVLATAEHLWALRYPDTHELYLLERDAGGHRGHTPLHARSRRIRAQSVQLGEQKASVVASERMDDDPNWRLLNPGELVRIAADLSAHSSYPLPEHPRRQLTLADLDPVAAASQHVLDR
jgi:predicted glutamine amidotransferase